MDGNHPNRKKDTQDPYTLSIENGTYYIAFADGQLVFRKIEEIVFDESRIPGIMQAYRELCQQEDGEDKDKIHTLRQNLKTVE